MVQSEKKKFISIRTRLFLQVGSVILIAICAILTMNNFLLPEIYIGNEKKLMEECVEEINKYDYTSPEYYSLLASVEKEHGFSIDIYLKDGTQLYYGSNDIFQAGNKVTITKRDYLDNGSHFEIQEVANSNTQYIVYYSPLSFDGEIEMYSKKSEVDANSDIAILITSSTSVLALLASLIFIYFYSVKFTKPLISMSRVTGKMAQMDFTEKCDVKSNDEVTQLSKSINHLSDSLCFTLNDLSEKNAKLQEDIEKEKTLEKIRKDFISNVSHELKTPISIIRGYSEGASLMLESGETENAKDYCNIIINETDKMNVLVLQLLELSRYESGSVSLDYEKFNLKTTFDDYANDSKFKLEEKNITFINNISEQFFAEADTIKINMVINNYISNAISHCDGEKQIVVSAREQNDKYRVFVFNTGNNISVEDIDKIWISFYRADKSHSRSEGRFGLGLSIVSAIQKLHNCDYGVNNTENGVCFWFDVKKASD